MSKLEEKRKQQKERNKLLAELGSDLVLLDRIDELEASVKFLLSFAPTDTVVPKGLDPTFYHTLSSEGDQKLANRINKIKAEVIK
jgi:hypothetical protein